MHVVLNKHIILVISRHCGTEKGVRLANILITVVKFNFQCPVYGRSCTWSLYCRIAFCTLSLCLLANTRIRGNCVKICPPKKPTVQFDQAPTQSDVPQTEWPKIAFSNVNSVLLVMQNGHVHGQKAIVVWKLKIWRQVGEMDWHFVLFYTAFIQTRCKLILIRLQRGSLLFFRCCCFCC